VKFNLYYWPHADEALDRLESDPVLAPALRAVDRTLVRLATDPYEPRLGTTSYRSPELGGISATPVRYDSWFILWRRGEEAHQLEIIAIAELPL
jgi:hypothetical protein